MAARYITHSSAYGVMMGNISCYNFLGVAGAMRSKLGLGKSAAASSATSAASTQTKSKSNVTQWSDDKYWDEIALLKWATTDKRGMTQDDVWDWLDGLDTSISGDELFSWMLRGVDLARRQCPALTGWGDDQIFSLIAFGRETFEKAISDFSFASALDGKRQPIDLFAILAEEAMSENNGFLPDRDPAPIPTIPMPMPMPMMAAQDDGSADDDDED